MKNIPKSRARLVVKLETIFFRWGRMQIKICLTSAHHSSNVVRNENIYFFRRWYSEIDILKSHES